VGTCLARVRFRRHWPGDVMFGAALGWSITYLIFCSPRAARLGYWVQDKVEAVIGKGRDAEPEER